MRHLAIAAALLAGALAIYSFVPAQQAQLHFEAALAIDPDAFERAGASSGSSARSDR